MMQSIIPLPFCKFQGMKYVHRSVIVCHGYLTGWRCLIDKHFTLKISELAFKRIAEEMVQEAAKPATRAMFKEHTAFWTAPEILRGESEPNKTTDVYSVGVILFEIFTQSLPYEGVTLLTQEGTTVTIFIFIWNQYLYSKEGKKNHALIHQWTSFWVCSKITVYVEHFGGESLGPSDTISMCSIYWVFPRLTPIHWSKTTNYHSIHQKSFALLTQTRKTNFKTVVSISSVIKLYNLHHALVDFSYTLQFQEQWRVDGGGPICHGPWVFWDLKEKWKERVGLRLFESRKKDCRILIQCRSKFLHSLTYAYCDASKWLFLFRQPPTANNRKTFFASNKPLICRQSVILCFWSLDTYM